MITYDYHYTKRASRILQLASCNTEIVHPHHLFLAACQESTGVCGELFLYLRKVLGSDFISLVLKQYKIINEASYVMYNESRLTNTTVIVLEKANEKKDYYNQVLINEGHIIRSILEYDSILQRLLGEKIIEDILAFACSPRDLIVNLKAFDPGKISYKNIIRKADIGDIENLKTFISKEFSDRWLKHTKAAHLYDNLPIFIAEHNGVIIGFACFDTVRNKKGLFGPMGTKRCKRLREIGKELVLRSLTEMKDYGYEYAVIDQAGPIEFYEKVCRAKLIPIF